MDNKQVRAHLRKGELAVQLLEGMGFRYTDAKAYAVPKWSAPDTFVNMEEARKEMQAVLDKFKPKEVVKLPPLHNTRTCPVDVGADFTIIQIPPGHYLRNICYRPSLGDSFKVTRTEYIDRYSSVSARLNGFIGWAIHFEFKETQSSQSLWLPLSHIKVKRDAHF
ncbi:hypothetical protein [Pseudomonas sp. PSPC3-3]|uniref:hypothetical protein n=1 Tax=unclassified Pseudomonas TaxID=196821 RepID=UPI003CF459CD